MKKLQEIDRLVEEALTPLEIVKSKTTKVAILTTLARKCAEINQEDLIRDCNFKITDYNSRLRDGQVEELHPAIQHINAEGELPAETVKAINKMAEVAYNTPMQPALQPLPDEVPEWFLKYYDLRVRENYWKILRQHFGTQPREWWHNLKKGDKFMYDNGDGGELRTYNNHYEFIDGDYFLYSTENGYGFGYSVNNCSPFTDPIQSFREKLTPELQAEFDKLIIKNNP